MEMLCPLRAPETKARASCRPGCSVWSRTAGGRRRCSRSARPAVHAGAAPANTLSGYGSTLHSTATPNQSVSEYDIKSLASTSDPYPTPEVVWGPGKSPDQIATKLISLTERHRVAMAARIDPETYSAVRMHAPGVEYNARAHTLKLRSATADQLPTARRLPGSIAVVSADTGDQMVAEEVKVLADYMGGYSYAIRDVGASNLHGLLAHVDSLRTADVVVVVAGTDCALPSLVAGVTGSPVIAVPTSSGFGASLGGLTPMLAALSSSTPGVSLVNIDGGYAAAAMAVRMLKMAARLHATRSAQEAAMAAADAAARSIDIAMGGNGRMN